MDKPIMIALDFPDLAQSLAFLDQFEQPEQLTVKIGMALFYAAGPKGIQAIQARGCRIFLDLKLFDIPNTVAEGMTSIGRLGVDYVTVHSLGGLAMLKAAKEGLARGSQAAGLPRPKLLAVTELTSISELSLREEQHCALPMSEQVLALARTAQQSGCDGVICSPLELALLKQKIKGPFLYVVPGIRLADAQVDDQVRIASPGQARTEGASAIVVGRPITKAADPRAAYQRYRSDWLLEAESAGQS
ncbi:orotidine-5'-phosphate decarboxylase [Leuconostocaceae bacterium ESL0958]|nr:orotidine-5'-phosphate decarboxylase [Leuconostocaceae bacterium ESL0958]